LVFAAFLFAANPEPVFLTLLGANAHKYATAAFHLMVFIQTVEM
jgi:hypothetical protein